jgi:hypothetical protein
MIPFKIYASANTVRTYNGIFGVQEIWQINIASQDSDSDDDVSALSGSDSDNLDTTEKADFVEF